LFGDRDKVPSISFVHAGSGYQRLLLFAMVENSEYARSEAVHAHS